MVSRRLARTAAIVAAVLVGIVVAGAPWAYGAVHTVTLLRLGVPATLAVLASAVFLFLSGRPGRVPVLVIPAVALVGVAVLQLVPLAPEWRRLASPGGTELRRASGAATDSAPVSFAPDRTRIDLVKLTHGLAVFVVAAWCAAEWPLVACSVLAGTGVSLAFFGIVQKLSWNGMLYWSVPLTQGGEPFGPFVNRNHAGAFLEVCLGAGIALVVASLTRRARSRSRHRAIVLGCALACLTILAGIVVAGSRGTWIAVAGGMLAIPFALRTRSWVASLRVAAVLVGISVAAWGVVVWTGLSSGVRARANTLADTRTAMESRLGQWEATATAAERFLPMGSGLGTHRYVVPAFESTAGPWYQHAENEYLDVLLELGLPGVALLLVAAIAALLAVRATLRSESRTDRAVGVGAAFALVAFAVHAGFDFAVRTPAVLLVACSGLGVVAGRALRERAEGRTFIPVPRTVGVVTAVVVAGLCTAGTLEAAAIVDREAALAEVREIDEPWNEPVDRHRARLERLAVLARTRPDSGELRRGMALARSAVLRAEWIVSRRIESDTLRRRAWDAWSPAGLMTSSIGRSRRSRGELTSTLNAMRTDLLEAHVAEPLRVEPLMQLAVIEETVGNRNDSREWLDRAGAIAPAHARTWFGIGVVHDRCGRVAEAAAAWKRCLALSSRFEEPVLRMAAGGHDVSSLVRCVLPDEPVRMLRMARERFLGDAGDPVRRAIAERALVLLADATDDDGTTSWLRGSASSLLGRMEDAVVHFDRAVELQPNTIGWRIDLATSLSAVGRNEEALDHARAGLVIAPPREKERFVRVMQSIHASEVH